MSLTRYVFRFLLAALLFGVAITPLLAQNAQMSGAITDPSGAVIPGATVVVTGTETGTIYKTITNGAGYYAVAQIQPGSYRMEVQKTGFKTLLRSAMVLQVLDNVTLNFTMEVGTATQAITVTAGAPVLRTADAEQGLVIDNKRIMELPQYDRNPLAFISLTPNVYGDEINGGRDKAVEYYLDGAPMTTGYRHDVPPSLPSKEAMEEFKVITNGISAEYGRLSGGAVIMSTRGGPTTSTARRTSFSRTRHSMQATGIPTGIASRKRYSTITCSGSRSAVPSAFRRFITAKTKPSSS